MVPANSRTSRWDYFGLLMGSALILGAGQRSDISMKTHVRRTVGKEVTGLGMTHSGKLYAAN